jgi:DNA-directed RNA polymerase subunit RPC12/RpoP
MKYSCIRCDCEHELKLKEVLGKQRVSCPDCGFEMIKTENRLERPIAC